VKILHGEIGNLPPIGVGHREALLGESVEGSPVVFSGHLEKRLDVHGGVSASTTVGGNARDQDICGGSVIDIVGQRLWLYGALRHPTILPFGCSFAGQTPARTQQGRSGPA
jgi:hypothetical protein